MATLSQLAPIYSAPPPEEYEKSVPGWPQVAKLLAQVPEFQSFQAFTDLNMKSLLYYQGELEDLRQELPETERKDNATPPLVFGVDVDVTARIDHLKLLRHSEDGNGRHQWVLILEIRDSEN